MRSTHYSLLRMFFPMLLTLCLLAAVTPPAVAEEESTWTPPTSEEWDWLHLNSGEWLKGEIKSMHDRKIRFDSDELDEL